jgi:cysteine-rich repeat protein
MTHLRRLLSLSVATTLVAGGALAAKIPPCNPGRYLAPPGDHIIFGEQTPATTAIQIDAGSVRIGCGTATKAKIKGTKKGTKVTAKWGTCGTLKNVVLTGTIGGNCTSLQGAFKAKKVKKVSFSAQLSGGCGDGRIDDGGGEQCEVTADCDAGKSCADCKCIAPTTTTTTIQQGSTTTVFTTTSTTTTTLSNCVGNAPDGQQQAGEECDDGNANERDGCTNACTICGNSTITAPETCDDGNLIDGDGCDSNCQPSACGNGIQGINESCDDGNTNNNDACPSDCVIDACTPNSGTHQQATVSFAGVNVAGISVLVDYPEGTVSIPGSGPSASSRISGLPSGTSRVTNDLDHALREVVQDSTPFATFAPGQLFKIDFETCSGAPALMTADFAGKCTVISASDGAGSDVTGSVTCSVTVP